MFKAVVFDIDGTLTRDISWVRLTKEIGGSIEFNDEVIRAWGKDKLSEKETTGKLIKNWSKDSRADKENFISILSGIPLREDAKETISYLKEKGYLVTLITGSFDLYAEIVGKELGVENYFANTILLWDDSNKLIDIKTVKDEEAKNRKIEYFKEWLTSNNLKPEECVAVGDSSNDIELFKITGNGIAMKTEFEAEELEKVAWKTINRLSELRSVL